MAVKSANNISKDFRIIYSYSKIKLLWSAAATKSQVIPQALPPERADWGYVSVRLNSQGPLSHHEDQMHQQTSTKIKLKEATLSNQIYKHK